MTIIVNAKEKLLDVVAGCGNAAAKTMSEMTGFEISLGRTNISIQDLDHISNQLMNNDEVVICNWFRIDGDISGTMLFYVPIDLENGNPDINMVQEYGVNVISSYMKEGKVRAHMHFSVEHSDMIQDQIAAILETTIVEYLTKTEEVCLFESEYLRSDGTRYYSIFFPEKAKLEKIIKEKQNEKNMSS